MKLHDLRPAPGSHKKKTRVGRGIAAGKGKTAGRGTKGQKARAGGIIPAWFEGGQTPLHVRIPKLRGFRNPFKIEYEVVNVGAITRLVEHGRPGARGHAGRQEVQGRTAPITVNQEILRAAGLVRTLNKPIKILGHGDLSVAALRGRGRVHRVGADQDRGSRRYGVSVLEVPTRPLQALGVTDEVAEADAAEPEVKPVAKPRAKKPAATAAAADPAAIDVAPAARGIGRADLGFRD